MDLDQINDYHIHLYYDENTIDLAQKIGQQAASLFSLPLGRFHKKNVGPHPRWSVQLTVSKESFSRALSWFSLNRQGLTVFIHPNTGLEIKDHSNHAIWMGELLSLNLSIFTAEN